MYLILTVKINFDDLCFAVITLILILFLCLLNQILPLCPPIKSCSMNVEETIYQCDINQNCSIFKMTINVSEINSSSVASNKTIIEFYNCEKDQECIQHIKKMDKQFYCLEISRDTNNDYSFPPFKITRIKEPTFNFIRKKIEVYNSELFSDIFLIIILITTWAFIIKFVFKINVVMEDVRRDRYLPDNVHTHIDQNNTKIKLKKMPECIGKNINEEDRICPICYCIIQIKEIYTPLQCFCRYHKKCISQYEKTSCPTCQK
jgi:hypothetical protein